MTQMAAGDNFTGATLPPPAPAPLWGGGVQSNNSGAAWEDVNAALTNLASAAKAQAGGADELVKSNVALMATNASKQTNN